MKNYSMSADSETKDTMQRTEYKQVDMKQDTGISEPRHQTHVFTNNCHFFLKLLFKSHDG